MPWRCDFVCVYSAKLGLSYVNCLLFICLDCLGRLWFCGPAGCIFMSIEIRIVIRSSSSSSSSSAIRNE